MYKFFIITTLFLFIGYSPQIKALEAITIKDFFSIEENQKDFNISKSYGNIVKARKRLLDSCSDQKDLDCNCFKREIEKTSDEELFYSSTLKYQQFIEEAEASQHKDQKKYIELKIKHAKQKNDFRKRLQKCLKKL